MQNVKTAITLALLPPQMDSQRARVMLWAIGLHYYAWRDDLPLPVVED